MDLLIITNNPDRASFRQRVEIYLDALRVASFDCKVERFPSNPVAADTLNDRALPFFEQHGVKLLRILTDCGTEYCGKREDHEYQLYLSLDNIGHSKTRSPQSNRICERYLMSSTESRFAKKSTTHLTNCRRIWILDKRVQRTKAAQRQVLFWENADADICGVDTAGKRKNAGQYLTDTRTNRSNRLSGQVVTIKLK